MTVTGDLIPRHCLTDAMLCHGLTDYLTVDLAACIVNHKRFLVTSKHVASSETQDESTLDSDLHAVPQIDNFRRGMNSVEEESVTRQNESDKTKQ